MRIIVTGGAGFIGCNLIKKLLENEENEIISIDNYFTGSKNNHIDNERVKYIFGISHNIRYYADFNPDIVYHFGEYSRVSPSFDEPYKVLEYNLRGTMEVIEFCRKQKCKLIYSGSTTIFGNTPSSPYVWTKKSNIDLIKKYGEWYGLEYTIVYFSNVYGQGQIESGLYSTVIGRFKKQRENNEPLTVVMPGTQTRDFTHIEDTIDAIILASTRIGDGYVIRTGVQYSIIDIAKMFKHDFVYIDQQKGDRLESSGDSSKMIELGWMPKHDVKEYIETLLLANP